MANNNWGTDIFRAGDTAQTDQNASFTAVSADYFAAVGTRVLLGRPIDRHDTSTSVHVAVVNQAFVDRFLHGKPPIGEHFGENPNMTSELEIVGVVDNTKYGDPNSPVRPMFFTPTTQTTTFTDPRDASNEATKHFANNIIVNYQGDQAATAAAIRRTLKDINPDIPIFSLVPYKDQLGKQFSQEEMVVRLTTLFGILALVLAALGLYGITAYNVQRRTNEIGIRMALGATRQSVLAMIVRNALVQAGIGLALGVPLSYAAGRLIESTLYKTPAFQPAVLASVIALLVLATIAAALLPARRAASIEPMQALRTD
jgi:predicted permease